MDNFRGKPDSHKKPTFKQVVGNVGEDYAADYLRGHGYKIIDRNYLRKWGEIDIVAINGKIIHFVEVKTVSRDFLDMDNVTHETPVAEQSSLLNEADDSYRPEDNIHPWKLQRLGRVIQSYLIDKDVSDETEWQFDVVTVYLDRDKRLIKIELIDDLVL